MSVEHSKRMILMLEELFLFKEDTSLVGLKKKENACFSINTGHEVYCMSPLHSWKFHGT